MNCPKCKKEIPADSLYCQFCGETIVKNKPQETKGKTVSKGWKVTTFLFLILAAVAGAMLYLEIDKANLKAAETQYVYFESPYYERSLTILQIAFARSRAYVGVPAWSKTTLISGFVAVRLSIVLQKFLPNSEYSQAVRIIT